MGAEKLADSYYVYSMPDLVSKESLDQLPESFDPGTEVVVLDFTHATKVNRAFFPLLHQLKVKLEKDNLEFISTNISLSLKSQLNADGVLRMFNLKDLSQPSPEEAKNQKKGIDVKFLAPFIKATTEILKVQANVDSKAGKPRIKAKDEKTRFDIIGIISLVSNVFEGSITLCFSERTFLNICESMLGEEYDKIDDEIEDAAGELLNIIFGVAKAELNDSENYQIQKAIPTVIRGPGMRVKQSVGPTIILPFESPAGEFQIEIEKAAP